MLKKLGMRPGDYDDGANFMLQNHVSQSLTPQQSADAIANHFAAVSQEFPPLEFSRLPQRVQIIISETIDYQNIPRLSEVNVWEVMKKVKVSSSVPGDIPAKLLKEFSPELAVPLTGVYNKIIESGEWPDQWKTEIGIPLAKVKNPISEDDVRVASLTSSYSKIF